MTVLNAMAVWLFLIVCLLADTGMAHASGKNRDILIVGSEENFPPFAIGKTDETADGYTIDLWKAVAKESGLKYSIRVRPWGQLLQEFKEGRIDVLINIAQSEERDKYTDFSVPHVTVYGAVFVRKGEPAIRSEADLAGKSIIVFKSDLAHEYAVAQGWQKQLVVVQTPQEGLRLLASGQHDAMLLSKLAGMQTLRELGIRNVTALDAKAGYSQRFSLGVRKGDSELLASLNEGLALTKASGAYDEIYLKWFGVYEVKKPTWKDVLPYGAPVLIVLLLAGSYDVRRRGIERKRAREALRASEENLRLILDSTEEAIFGVDLKGICTFCNAACARLLGYSRADDLIGKNMHALIHHSYSDGSAYPVEHCRIHEALKQEKGTHADDEVLWRSDGTSFPAEYRSYLQVREGKAVGAVIVFTDITERRFKEKAHLQAGNLLQLATTYSDLHECMAALTASLQNWSGCEAVGIRLRDGSDYPYYETVGFPAEFVKAENRLCDYDPEGNVIRDGDGNPVLACMCGNILCGRFDPSRSFFTARGSFWTNSTTELLAGTSEAERQARTRNRCNGEGYESVALIPMHAGDQVIGLIQFNDHHRDRFTSSLIDTFEGIADKVALALARRVAEKELQAREKLHRDLLNTIPDPIWLKDAEGVYLSCNSAFERLFGAGEADIVGRTDYDFVEKELADFFREHDRNAMTAGMPTSNEEWVTFASGSHRALLYTTKAPMYDNEGKLIGVVGVGRDITEKTRLEAQLLQAQKIDSVGRLAGGVAHDFNNMLTVILCQAELGLMAHKSSDQLANFAEIKHAAERSAELTRQLLAFARKQTVTPRMLDLNEAITGMLKMLQRLVGENIHLSCQSSADLWQVRVDPSQIDQILANLCVNARDAIRDGGIITIETGNCVIDDDYCKQHVDMEPGEYVRLAVSDNGCGMDRDTMDCIFEPFFTTKGTGQGTGLGLAMVFGIVKQNEGFINVSSEVGLGTTFTIMLPRYIEQAGEPRKVEPEETHAPHGVETILLVEDEPAILHVTTMILARQGYTVLQTTNPLEALRLAEEHAGTISLLITDVIMPGMNGHELAQNVKQRCPQLKSLFMSGYTADVISRHGVLDEGLHFIQKPFSLPDLAAKIRQVLDGV